MAGSTFGSCLRVHTFGESHGGAVGCVVDGFPPGFLVDVEALQAQLDRRRPGQSALVSQRKEADRVTILSGLDPTGRTLGTPVAMTVQNTDGRPEAYEGFAHLVRPSHADYTYEAKYGIRAPSGGGRASARETVGRVAAGALAEQILAQRWGVAIVAWVAAVGSVRLAAELVDEASLLRSEVDAHATRCPDLRVAARMEAEIVAARSDGDTVGGLVRAVVRGVPPGWGEPVFDKLEACLAAAMLSIPACKGFESGAGFEGAGWRGSEHNDAFSPGPAGRPITRTNHSGGIQGGISNGMPIRFATAFKPTATIVRPQDTVDAQGNAATIRPKGRHDPCVVPRAVPIVEAMAALVLLDLALRQQAVRRDD